MKMSHLAWFEIAHWELLRWRVISIANYIFKCRVMSWIDSPTKS